MQKDVPPYGRRYGRRILPANVWQMDRYKSIDSRRQHRLHKLLIPLPVASFFGLKKNKGVPGMAMGMHKKVKQALCCTLTIRQLIMLGLAMMMVLSWRRMMVMCPGSRMMMVLSSLCVGNMCMWQRIMEHHQARTYEHSNRQNTAEDFHHGLKVTKFGCFTTFACA